MPIGHVFAAWYPVSRNMAKVECGENPGSVYSSPKNRLRMVLSRTTSGPLWTTSGIRR